jgi:subtilase family serine protease
MLSSTLLAQEDRINAPIDSRRTALLRGNLHPKATRRYDRGPVDPGQKMAGIRLMLKPTAAQQAALDRLLEEQQDPVSPNYHNWLTPEQYADRFGVSQSDADKIAAWLQTEGFAVDQVARGRDWISFSGTAGHVLKTFRTPIHRYRVDGETHFANAAEPSVPAVLEPLVRAIRGLDDFYPKPRAKFRGAISANPEFNFSDGSHALAPGDIATIYDVNPLYQRGITGSGQKIAVIGQTDFNLSDVELFRSSYGLPKNDPQKILAGADPGIKQGELGEANADLDWTGAVAPNASILYA